MLTANLSSCSSGDIIYLLNVIYFKVKVNLKSIFLVLTVFNYLLFWHFFFCTKLK